MRFDDPEQPSPEVRWPNHVRALLPWPSLWIAVADVLTLNHSRSNQPRRELGFPPPIQVGGDRHEGEQQRVPAMRAGATQDELSLKE